MRTFYTLLYISLFTGFTLFSCSSSKKDIDLDNLPTSDAGYSSVQPGIAGGGDEMTIVGSKFGTNTSDIEVVVGNVKAEILSVLNSVIKFTLPSSSTWKNNDKLEVRLFVRKQNAGSKSIVYTTDPQILRFVPSQGIPGQEMLIQGRRFGTDKSKIKVVVGDFLGNVKSVTEESITIDLPDEYMNIAPVRVRKGDIESKEANLRFNLVKYDSLIVVNPDNWYATETIRQDIKWKSWRLTNTDGSSRGTKVFNKRRSINVLEIEPQAAGINTQIGFDYLLSGYKKTSAFCTAANALVGINGPYFDTSVGGVNDYLRVNGTMLVAGRTSTSIDARITGALAWTDKTITILKVAGNLGGPKVPSEHKNVMLSGPILLENAQVILPLYPNDSHYAAEHPRTAVGTTKDGKILFVTVDGRFTNAVGLSTIDLSLLMRFLGANNAINLDGGGSTAMWIKNKPNNGIVNYPSDNGKFDHLGERALGSGVLYVK